MIFNPTGNTYGITLSNTTSNVQIQTTGSSHFLVTNTGNVTAFVELFTSSNVSTFALPTVSGNNSPALPVLPASTIVYTFPEALSSSYRSVWLAGATASGTANVFVTSGEVK